MTKLIALLFSVGIVWGGNLSPAHASMNDGCGYYGCRSVPAAPVQYRRYVRQADPNDYASGFQRRDDLGGYPAASSKTFNIPAGTKVEYDAGSLLVGETFGQGKDCEKLRGTGNSYCTAADGSKFLITKKGEIKQVGKAPNPAVVATAVQARAEETILPQAQPTVNTNANGCPADHPKFLLGECFKE